MLRATPWARGDPDMNSTVLTTADRNKVTPKPLTYCTNPCMFDRHFPSSHEMATATPKTN